MQSGPEYQCYCQGKEERHHHVRALVKALLCPEGRQLARWD